MKFILFSTLESRVLLEIEDMIKDHFSSKFLSSVSELTSEEDYDYLILDYDLEKKADKLIKEIKNLHPDKSLVALSNKLSTKELVRAQNSKGAADFYLRYPISLSLLVKVLGLPEIKEEVREMPQFVKSDVLIETGSDDEVQDLPEINPSEEKIKDEVTSLKLDTNFDSEDLEVSLGDESIPNIPNLAHEDSLSLDEEIEDEGLSLEDSLVSEDLMGELKEDEIQTSHDEASPLSLDSGMDLEIDLGVNEEDNLDLSLPEEDGLDLSQPEEDNLDLFQPEEDSLDLSLPEEEPPLEGTVSEEENSSLDDLFPPESTDSDLLNFSVEESANEDEKNSLSSEFQGPKDDLDLDNTEENLFKEFPSAPELDALDLHEETPLSEEGLDDDFSPSVLEKLKEINDFMDGTQQKESEDLSFVSDEVEEEDLKVTEELKKDHQKLKEYHSSELTKLGMTLEQLREDREKLLEEIELLKVQHKEGEREILSLKSELDEKNIENSLMRKRLEKEIENLKFKLDLSSEKKELLQQKNKELEREYQKTHEQVRVDVKKIRTRERELESQIELLRSDSEIQIKNRDQKILELKRRIDSLEFDLDSVKMNEKKSLGVKNDLEDKVERVVQTLKLAIGELGEDEGELLRKRIKKGNKNLDV